MTIEGRGKLIKYISKHKDQWHIDSIHRAIIDSEGEFSADQISIKNVRETVLGDEGRGVFVLYWVVKEGGICTVLDIEGGGYLYCAG